MDGWRRRNAPLGTLLTPPPRILSPPYSPFSRGTPYSTCIHILWKPCLRTRSLLCFSLLFCAPPDAYHRTSGRRVKYIASPVSCSRVGFVPRSSSYLADNRVGRLVGDPFSNLHAGLLAVFCPFFLDRLDRANVARCSYIEII